MQTTESQPDITFRRLIGTGMAGKLLVDIGNQIFNPFLPVIAAGLGISVVTLGQLVGLRSAMGIFSPFSGAIADRHGYRLVIRVALLANAAGYLLLAFAVAPWMVVAGMMLAGLGIGIFVPNLQAYVSGKLPYHLRARGLGMIEYSWALTGIVGLSLVGLLIAATNWRTPFILLAVGMVAMSFVFGALPGIARDRDAIAAPPAGSRWQQATAIFNLRTNRRSAYATILAGALSYFAAMQIMIAHGAWLAEQYGLGPAQLGFVAFIFGWFDLAASVSVSLFTDRIGKRRSVLIGIIGSLAGYALMPVLNTSVTLAVVAIAFARMCFEFNIVSHFPLLSEQVPAQRGQAMTLGSAAALVAGTVAGFSGPWLLVTLGVPALAWSSGLAVALAIAIVLLLVREQPEALTA
ncbi:MAG: MFS transporter [Caldilineaceae bacterium]|nr:MFS transporter [Caldilineaceae bacterium]